jgi:hypothetical protein
MPKRKDQIQGKQVPRLLVAAIFCGPLAGLAIITTLLLLGALMSAADGGSVSFPVEIVLVGALYGAIIGWPMMVVFGLPAHAFLYRRKSHRVSAYVLAGALGGLVASLIAVGLGYLAGFFGPDSMLFALGGWFSVLLLVSAVTASSFFWLIRRPDRDVPRPATLAATFE